MILLSDEAYRVDHLLDPAAEIAKVFHQLKQNTREAHSRIPKDSTSRMGNLGFNQRSPCYGSSLRAVGKLTCRSPPVKRLDPSPLTRGKLTHSLPSHTLLIPLTRGNLAGRRSGRPAGLIPKATRGKTNSASLYPISLPAHPLMGTLTRRPSRSCLAHLAHAGEIAVVPIRRWAAVYPLTRVTDGPH